MPTNPSLARTAETNLNVQKVVHNGLTWVNIECPTLAEMAYLRDNYPSHPLDLDDCLSKVQLPKVDAYPEYLFLVLHFPFFDDRNRLTIPSQVNIFIGANYLVTVHSGDLRQLVKLFYDCLNSDATRQNIMASSSGYLLYRILDGLVDYSFPIVNKIIAHVDELELKVFDTSARGLIREINEVRRDILSFRRIVRPQFSVLEILEGKDFPFLKVEGEIYFGDLADHWRRIWVELEDLKEVIEGLGETYGSLATYHTNNVIRVLTIFGSILLPFLVISGIYGMNVGLPLADGPVTFFLIMLVSLMVGAGMVFFFRWKHWI